MIEFYFSKITHFFWPPREQQIISSNTLQGTVSYICLLEALGQTHPWSNSTDANGGSSIANLKCSKGTSQVGKKKNLKNQEIEKEPEKEPKKERGKKMSKVKRVKKSQKKKGGLGVDLPSGFRVLRVVCLCFFSRAS